MLFLVISSPEPSKPADDKQVRLKFRTWIENLKSEGKVITFYPRVGRGSIVIFDVKSNDELHELMTLWLNIVPAYFDTYPLATVEGTGQLLK